jgi:hypothetical protein
MSRPKFLAGVDLKKLREYLIEDEWKFLRRPAKHNLPNLAPLWANGNFGANRSDVVAAGIYQRNVKVAVFFPCLRRL